MTELTPVEKYGNIYIKRDDLFEISGVRGGKARTCQVLCNRANVGITTAGSRFSPQINIVAHIAKDMGLPFVAHTPMGKLSAEILEAQELGAKIIQHKAGYNSVIIKRCHDFAIANGYTEIPFGMECTEAVAQTKNQVANIPLNIKRIVMPVGSGMSLCGVLYGLKENNINIPVLGIVVGSSPIKRLNKYAPAGWENMVTLIKSNKKYHEGVSASAEGIDFDPIYEAKCIKHLLPGDLLWIVGLRNNLHLT